MSALQELAPEHVIMQAWGAVKFAPLSHDPVPVQLAMHTEASHTSVPPLHELLPQLNVHSFDVHVAPPLHAFSPSQFSVHDFPPTHWTPAQLSFPLHASVQSVPWGQRTGAGPLHEASAQRNAHSPFVQLPPASLQVVCAHFFGGRLSAASAASTLPSARASMLASALGASLPPSAFGPSSSGTRSSMPRTAAHATTPPSAIGKANVRTSRAARGSVARGFTAFRIPAARKEAHSASACSSR